MSRRRPLASTGSPGPTGRTRSPKPTKPTKARKVPKAPKGPKSPKASESAKSPKPRTRAKSGRRPSTARSVKGRVGAASATPKSRRRLGALTKTVLLGGLVVTALALGVQWLLHQSYFRVQHVTFTGLRHETSAQALVASGLDRHPTMIALSTASVQRNLDRFSWIDGVSVIKRWPDTVEVRVRESVPVAVAFAARHKLQYVDAYGRDLGPAPLNVNLPTLEYLHPAQASWPFRRAGYDAAYVASVLPRAFAAQVSVVTVNAHGTVSLKMTTPVSFVLGPPIDLNAKFVAIASVIAHSTLGPGSVVDVTVPGELAVSGPPPG